MRVSRPRQATRHYRSPDAPKTNEERPSSPPCVILEAESNCSQNDGDGAAPKRMRLRLGAGKAGDFDGQQFDREALRRDFDLRTVAGFRPVTCKDREGRDVVILDSRAAKPAVPATAAHFAVASAAGQHGGGLDLRKDSNDGSVKYVCNIVEGAGHDATVYEAFKSGDPGAADVVVSLLGPALRRDVEASNRDTTLVLVAHHNDTVPKKGDRTYEIFDRAITGVARVGIDTTIAKRREILDKAPKDRKEREAHHKDTIVVSDEALKLHNGKRLVVGDDDRWTGFTAQAVVDALRAAIERLELNIEVETVVFARYVWATRTTPTISELAPCVREVIRAESKRILKGEGEVSKKDAQHVGIVYCIEFNGETYTVPYDIYGGSFLPSVDVTEDEGAKLHEAHKAGKMDLVRSIATDILGERARKHQSDVECGRHNKSFTPWLKGLLETNPGLDLKTCIKPMVVIFSRKGDTRKLFYNDGLLTWEQAVLWKFRAAADCVSRRPTLVPTSPRRLDASTCGRRVMPGTSTNSSTQVVLCAC